MLARHEGTLLRTGIAGVALYVTTWFVLGVVREDYDPLQQAISELFAIGAPRGQALLLAVVLAVTGALLVPFGLVLDRVLPGSGRLGPVLVVVSGVGTFLVAFAPCTAGCPGVGASTTDTLHVVFAGGGYLALVTAPLAVARRTWRVAPGLARISLALGLAASIGFLVRNLGLDAYGGLQQRVFNTTADVWLAVAAWSGLRHRAATASGASAAARPRSAHDTSPSETSP
jgi:hypothetical membrane protein